MKRFRHCYWMNATDGTIIAAKPDNGVYAYVLAPMSSIFLVAGEQKLNTASSGSKAFDPEKANVVAALSQWDIEVKGMRLEKKALFDWKTDTLLRYSEGPAAYTATFNLSQIDSTQLYFLDMGTVYYSADLQVNGRKVGTSIYTPFLLDITAYIRTGENSLKITLTNARYNQYVGEAEKGERLFKKLQGQPTMSAGLLGPVRIVNIRKNPT